MKTRRDTNKMSAEPSLKLMKIEIKGNKVVRKEFKSLAI